MKHRRPQRPEWREDRSRCGIVAGKPVPRQDSNLRHLFRRLALRVHGGVPTTLQFQIRVAGLLVRSHPQLFVPRAAPRVMIVPAATSALVGAG